MVDIEVHGTPDYAELEALGLAPSDVIYFSSNINPFGPPRDVVDALRSATTPEQIALYPDRFSTKLRRRLAAYHGVSPDAILVGNGSADLMWLLSISFAHAKRIVILGPTFSEYENLASMMPARCDIVAHPGWMHRGAEYSQSGRTLNEVAQEIAGARPDLVFICNPNNPTGSHLTASQLQMLHGAAPDATWIVDEAYAEFTSRPWSAIDWIDDGRWIVLRSMTKDFSLGGLRLGYLAANPARIAALRRIQPPWNVNVYAQIAGEVALGCQSWRRETTVHLREYLSSMSERLRSYGFEPQPSTVNYFLLPVETTAATARDSLLKEGLVVRDCTSFGLPNHIRIAVQKADENERLIAALAQL
jgi:histidinol-phosphate aminotransferase